MLLRSFLRRCAPPRRLSSWPASACTALAAALLTACSSTPLPPWPTAPAAQTPGAARPVAPPPPTAPAPSGGTPPYGASVSAKFPDPPTVYDTPGLAPGRRAFTTNAELGQWLEAIAAQARSPNKLARVFHAGKSQRGAPILGLLLTGDPATDRASPDTSDRPTVLLIGAQHGDEPASTEALLVISRELAQGMLEGLLKHIQVIVVPRANPDGIDAGTRNTANGVDMNHDHLLLNTPEARALARLVSEYRPVLVVEAHEFTVAGRYLQKFNAVQRYDALLQYTTTANYPEFLTRASQEWYFEPMTQALTAQGLTSDWYYTTPTDPQDKRISMGTAQPDTGRNVNGLKNAVSLMIATRGVGIGRMHIQRRVHTQVTAITSVLESTVKRAADLKRVQSFVEREVSAQACRDQVVLEAAATPGQRNLDFLDPETGAQRSIHVDWDSTLALRPTKSRTRPCGYWLAASSTAAVERLRLLGLQVMRIAESGTALAETYHETAHESGVRGPIAGDPETVRVQVAVQRRAIDLPAGSFYVPLNQPRAHLAVAALEPDTPHSYFANRVLDELAQTARIMVPVSLVFEDTE
ncbi:peptidase M14 [Verminephrobacter aporrectodeae subsp. tuberculatae]|uniref:Peptidase M14 n=1 Tax=Verminephrobacter aporrectodeae subsp. tuberculatae TaxID=1110392 RepID=A0ABT3KR11_9BURK|nr:M14 family metallopeptidase [Verminephrobacter aporrectodeae]MCW5320758.1 peptidase M14 [Verminephrobacter aporrectodeae subsp. tuberculatae]